jgi:hypothetical protein
MHCLRWQANCIVYWIVEDRLINFLMHRQGQIRALYFLYLTSRHA